MKKSFAIIALAALVMLAGCKKNDPKPNGTRLIAGIEKHKSDSKTSLDGLQIKWSESDKLYVNNGNTSACFTLVSGAGTTTGEFATNGDYTFAAENNLAVYPYNDNITVNNTTVTMTLPAEQTASGAGSFGNNANPMLGTFSDMDNLTLTSLCGVLCLQLTGNAAITAIEIVGGPDDKLNGTFTVDYMNPVLTYSANGTNTVRLNCEATLTSMAQKFYVVVPAVTLHGFTMKVYYDNNVIFSKSTANEVPVSVNTLSTMTPVEVVPFNPLTTPLTFEAREDGVTVGLNTLDGYGSFALEYSKNGGDWTSLTNAVTLNTGETVSFRGNNQAVFGNKFTCSGPCYIYGNVMSLLHAGDYATNYTFSEESAFTGLFYNNSNINIPTNKDLVLPATTLANYCYYEMFKGCTGLTKTPELPATTMRFSCYLGMFSGCTGLTTVPADLLPTTTMTNASAGCYQEMFYGCENLTAAPNLPATTLAMDCYRSMFYGCKSLTTAPELPATNLTPSCYYEMFYGCENLTTAPALPAETLENQCYYSMFRDCKSLTTAPTLPAPALVNSCYYSMFRDCIQLNSVTCLATSGINQYYSTANWLYGVASSGTFTKAAGASVETDITSWQRDTNGIPNGWNIVNDGPAPDYVFSVSATTTVHFSSGNLYYDGSSWGFESTPQDSQYNNGGYINVFRWGANGNTAAPNHGVDIYTESAYCDIESGVLGDYGADWGQVVGELDGATGWRTLTSDEWNYIRTNGHYGLATVNGYKGLILLPDDSEVTINEDHSSYSNNQITELEWNSNYKPLGVVFLPAAGSIGPMYDDPGTGVYWSSSRRYYSGGLNAGYRCFSFIFRDEHGPNYNVSLLVSEDGNHGQSVRLVR